MKTITFYSYKGGVGRSLTLSNIAMRLVDLGKKVCLIDFDLEAPGLHLKFKNYIDSEKLNLGVVDYIYNYQTDSEIPQKLKDFVLKINYQGTLNGSISLLPAGSVKNDGYWKKLASINWNELFYSDESEGVELLLHLKQLIKKELNPDFLLIDSRTGITDISGIAMTLLSDSVVTLAANNDENITGTARVIRSLLKEENNLTGKAPDIHFVLTRIPYYSNPSKKHIESRLINEALNKINQKNLLIEKVFVIHSDRELEEKEIFKINQNSGISSNNKNLVPIEEDYLNLFEEITKNDLSAEEIERFNKLRECELLIEEANNDSDNATKIKLLRKAISLNNKSHEAFNLLANVFGDLGEYTKALENAKKARKILKSKPIYGFSEAFFLSKLEKYDEAISILDEVLKEHEDFYQALWLMGHIYSNLKNYEKALEYQLRITEVYNGDHVGFNSVANTLRRQRKHNEALNYTFKSLELKPNNQYATGTLAEIYSDLGNENEFFKNLQLSFVFGMTPKEFQRVVEEEIDVYSKYFENPKFLNLLKSYRIKVDLESLNTK